MRLRWNSPLSLFSVVILGLSENYSINKIYEIKIKIKIKKPNQTNMKLTLCTNCHIFKYTFICIQSHEHTCTYHFRTHKYIDKIFVTHSYTYTHINTHRPHIIRSLYRCFHIDKLQSITDSLI